MTPEHTPQKLMTQAAYDQLPGEMQWLIDHAWDYGREDGRQVERERWLPLFAVNKRLVRAIENVGAPVEVVEEILTEIYSVMKLLEQGK